MLFGKGTLRVPLFRTGIANKLFGMFGYHACNPQRAGRPFLPGIAASVITTSCIGWPPMLLRR